MSRDSRTRVAFAVASLILLVVVSAPQAAETAEPTQLMIRCDDVGMCHGVNTAVRELLATGLPFSASVMFACPWHLEAVEILRDHPEVGVGVHLTLNSEWEHYKWGPVVGAAKVPSLVDANGHFHPTETAFAAAGPNLDEVRVELEAQIQRALATGLRIDYIDFHMLTAVSTPDLQAIVEQLAAKHGLGISRYFGERSVSLWDVAPGRKLPRLLESVRQARPGLNLVVLHVGTDTPEMAALIDSNYAADPYRVAIHRQAELEAVTSPAFWAALQTSGIELLNYRDLVQRRGLAAMKAPEVIGSYSTSFTETP
ncbi:MAG TPA: ChbG/HpnK family deacetylase [Thermoanaerobaculales bacterium]|nr:ChbG/HpnK family deacetylase [Thermoanaerobaculales bacterium]HPA80286.1 ChbG/HpnK family deacetylase [Thermoanaerobaculales bacterium]HQL31329.1 ChbG/HpnK family deacetylase [Thermoanaerobaculales bacterium]HQP43335.1 ChbG/HpnK family deacetylase [Thermoanaerobaculales bacterium]